MFDFIREFKFGRPQQIAAVLLIAFFGLAFNHTLSAPADSFEEAIAASGTNQLTGAVWLRCTGCYGKHVEAITAFLSSGAGAAIYRWLVGPFPMVIHQGTYRDQTGSLKYFFRFPFLLLGLSLAGALWWVTRRLYNDSGGYIALALFCFSLPMVFYSSRVNPDVIAAWGLYGLIYTAIGVAHTLYAPPRKWRPRILLLGTALGVTAGAYFAAAMIGLILAAGFMLYLAPGRRKQSIGILTISCVIALVWLVLFYGFDLHALAQALGTREAWAIGLRHTGAVVPGVQSRLMELLFAIALITYIAWKRTRYFGNTAPLIAGFVLHLVGHDGAQAAIWALPFVFTFIGGVFADLLETRRRRLVSWALLGSGAVYAALAVTAVFTLG